MGDDTQEVVGWVVPSGLVGVVTPTGYTPHPQATLEQMDEDAEILVGIEAAMHWCLGDWLNAGEDKFDQAIWQARAISSKSEQWWQQVRRVALRVPVANRFRELPWSFHQAVAALELKDQRRLLKKALDGDWEREQLRAQVALIANGNTPLLEGTTVSKETKPNVDAAKTKSAAALALEAKRAAAEAKRQKRIQRQEEKAAAKAAENKRRKDTREAKARGEDPPAPATPEMPEAVYHVLLADPPWRYEDPPMGVTNRSIENHYETMALAELVKLPVADLAAPDAVMFMWSTVPNLPAAMVLLEAWGFQYRTHMVWRKSKIGMGHYVRNQHEVLLIGKRGTPVMPAERDRPPSVFDAPTRRHSEKPEIALEIIERMYPDYSRIYLFPGGPLSRGHRDSWATWGTNHRVEMQEAAE